MTHNFSHNEIKNIKGRYEILPTSQTKRSHKNKQTLYRKNVLPTTNVTQRGYVHAANNLGDAPTNGILYTERSTEFRGLYLAERSTNFRDLYPAEQSTNFRSLYPAERSAERLPKGPNIFNDGNNSNMCTCKAPEIDIRRNETLVAENQQSDDAIDNPIIVDLNHQFSIEPGISNLNTPVTSSAVLKRKQDVVNWNVDAGGELLIVLDCILSIDCYLKRLIWMACVSINPYRLPRWEESNDKQLVALGIILCAENPPGDYIQEMNKVLYYNLFMESAFLRMENVGTENYFIRHRHLPSGPPGSYSGRGSKYPKRGQSGKINLPRKFKSHQPFTAEYRVQRGN
ncbi:2993_t:CDS:2 [Paraglomus occultum]|uniref:2993_t:CDS:1 n=1 Tax=Paraglomus occultum TaxID=144539 RepID=A0A9N9F9C2_9GLOM|nr:2993_t:CDS:2 [Paraglomus occultum]